MKKISTILFTILGVTLYYDWLLPSNPKTKNIWYRKQWYENITVKKLNVHDRLSECNYNVIVHVWGILVIGFIHAAHFIFLGLLGFIVASWVHWIYIVIQIMYNIYPILVQFMVAKRLNAIVRHRNTTR